MGYYDKAENTHTRASGSVPSKALPRVDGLYVSGLRYYSPQIGRWINRDPLCERAFFVHFTRRLSYLSRKNYEAISLNSPYDAFKNNGIGQVDLLGLQPGGSLLPGENTGGGSSDQKCCVMNITGGMGLGTVNMIHQMATTVADESDGELRKLLPAEDHVGLVNAFRHCIAACMLSASFGPTVSWAIEKCHESKKAETLDDVADAYNNTVGNRLGNSTTPPTPSDCGGRCLTEMTNGGLDLKGGH